MSVWLYIEKSKLLGSQHTTHKYLRREGSPGNYTYIYDDKKKSNKANQKDLPPFASFKKAKTWSSSVGLFIAISSPKKVTLKMFNEVATSLAKMPKTAIDVVNKNGIRLELVANHGITAHSSLSHLRGKQPRGWPKGSTWDEVPGAGGSSSFRPTVVVANRLQNHGGINLVLHEHAHAVDNSLNFSSIPDWKKIHKKAKWYSTYEDKYPEEAWAESFAQYYAGDVSRKKLPLAVRKYFHTLFDIEHVQKSYTYNLVENNEIVNKTKAGSMKPGHKYVSREGMSGNYAYEYETPRVKYPRTPHLPWSLGRTSDDKVLTNTTHFEGKDVVVTAKLDGENTTLYRDGIHARSLDSAHHPSRAWVKALQAQIGHDIPQGWRIAGENLFATHSIHYEALPSYFAVFSIWNEKNECLSWDDTLEWCDLLGLNPAPTLYRGTWNEDNIKACNTKMNVYGADGEGYVVRTSDSFPYSDFKNHIAKFVRENHVQTDEHWMQKDVVPNKLAKAKAGSMKPGHKYIYRTWNTKNKEWDYVYDLPTIEHIGMIKKLEGYKNIVIKDLEGVESSSVEAVPFMDVNGEPAIAFDLEAFDPTWIADSLYNYGSDWREKQGHPTPSENAFQRSKMGVVRNLIMSLKEFQEQGEEKLRNELTNELREDLKPFIETYLQAALKTGKEAATYFGSVKVESNNIIATELLPKRNKVTTSAEIPTDSDDYTHDDAENLALNNIQPGISEYSAEMSSGNDAYDFTDDISDEQVKDFVVTNIAVKLKEKISEKALEHVYGMITGFEDPEGSAADPELSLAYNVVNILTHSWAVSSTNSTLSIALQRLVAEEFKLPEWEPKLGSGIDTVSYQDWKNSQSYVNDSIFKRVGRRFIREMYNQTQEELDGRPLTLYRGVSNMYDETIVSAMLEAGKANNKAVAGIAQINLNPASSFSFDTNEAAKFAIDRMWNDSQTLEEMAKTKNVRLVMAAHVPAKRVLSLYTTGWGCRGESEAVVLGGPTETQWVVATSRDEAEVVLYHMTHDIGKHTTVTFGGEPSEATELINRIFEHQLTDEEIIKEFAIPKGWNIKFSKYAIDISLPDTRTTASFDFNARDKQVNLMALNSDEQLDEVVKRTINILKNRGYTINNIGVQKAKRGEEIPGHKYIDRKGTPGKYTYVYVDSQKFVQPPLPPDSIEKHNDDGTITLKDGRTLPFIEAMDLIFGGPVTFKIGPRREVSNSSIYWVERSSAVTRVRSAWPKNGYVTTVYKVNNEKWNAMSVIERKQALSTAALMVARQPGKELKNIQNIIFKDLNTIETQPDVEMPKDSGYSGGTEFPVSESKTIQDKFHLARIMFGAPFTPQEGSQHLQRLDTLLSAVGSILKIDGLGRLNIVLAGEMRADVEGTGTAAYFIPSDSTLVVGDVGNYFYHEFGHFVDHSLNKSTAYLNLMSKLNMSWSQQATVHDKYLNKHTERFARAFEGYVFKKLGKDIPPEAGRSPFGRTSTGGEFTEEEVENFTPEMEILLAQPELHKALRSALFKTQLGSIKPGHKYIERKGTRPHYRYIYGDKAFNIAERYHLAKIDASEIPKKYREAFITNTEKKLDALNAIVKFDGQNKLNINGAGAIGAWRMAEYVPGTLTIWIGRGTAGLAHEIGHYFDHILGFAMHNEPFDKKDAIFGAYVSGAYASTHRTNVAETSLVEAYRTLMKSLEKMPSQVGFYSEYHRNPTEVFARAFDAYVYSKLGSAVDDAPPLEADFTQDEAKIFSTDMERVLDFGGLKKAFESLLNKAKKGSVKPGHKYVSRTGPPGKYDYEYDDTAIGVRDLRWGAPQSEHSLQYTIDTAAKEGLKKLREIEIGPGNGRYDYVRQDVLDQTTRDINELPEEVRTKAFNLIKRDDLDYTRTSYDLSELLLASWIRSSMGLEPVRIALMSIVEKEFHTTPISTHYEDAQEVSSDTQKLLKNDAVRAVLTRFAHSVYDRTQTALKEAGIDKVLLYRGVIGMHSKRIIRAVVEAASSDAYGISGRMGIELNPLSSFTTDPSRSFHYGGYGMWSNGTTLNDFKGGTETSYKNSTLGLILSTVVPRERIFSLPFTGIGYADQNEVIVLGSSGDMAAWTSLDPNIENDIPVEDGPRFTIENMISSIEKAKRTYLYIPERMIHL